MVDRRSFKSAVDFMSEHMLTWAKTCDWLLPMETDEIVFDTQSAQREVRPEEVGRVLADHLGQMKADVGVVAYGKFLGSLVDPGDAGYIRGAYSRPIRQMNRFINQGWDKIIVRSASFVKMKLWCHHAITLPGFRKVTSDRLGLLHFHDTGMRRQIERAKPVVKEYGYFDCTDTSTENTLDELLAHGLRIRDAPIACGHKVRYLVDHLMRRATLLAFRRFLGRLPTGLAEMDTYAKDLSSHPATGVQRDLSNGSLRRDMLDTLPARVLTFQDLLYLEMRQMGINQPSDAGADGAGADGTEYTYVVDLSAVKRCLPVWITGMV